MQEPAMLPVTPAGADTHLLTTYAPLHGLGVVPVNAFLLHARQPVFDTGVGGLHDGFLRELGGLIDPADLRWIWITHADADHVGNLRAILDLAPNARVVTNYLGMGKFALQGLPLARVHLLNPGQQLDVGDRQLLALRLVTELAPSRVLSSHLPPALGITTERLINELLGACDAAPFVGPDQAALEVGARALAPA